MTEEFEEKIERERIEYSKKVSNYRNILIGLVTIIVLFGIITFAIMPLVTTSKEDTITTSHTYWVTGPKLFTVNGIPSADVSIKIQPASTDPIHYYIIKSNRFNNIVTQYADEQKRLDAVKQASDQKYESVRGDATITCELSSGKYYLVAVPSETIQRDTTISIYVTISQNPFIPLYYYILLIMAAGSVISALLMNSFTARIKKLNTVTEETADDAMPPPPEPYLPQGTQNMPAPSSNIPQMPGRFAPNPQQHPQQGSPYGLQPGNTPPSIPPRNPYGGSMPQKMPPQDIPREVQPIAPPRNSSPVETTVKKEDVSVFENPPEDPLNPTEEEMEVTEEATEDSSNELFEENVTENSGSIEEQVDEVVVKSCPICGTDVEVEKSKIPTTVTCPFCMSKVEFS